MSETIDVGARADPDDRRVLRTRAAIRSGFNALILSREYDTISAADIARAADVGRSTFYEHFSSKEAVLEAVLSSLLAPLADACASDAADPRLEATIAHFWSARRLATRLLSGRSGEMVTRWLERLILERLPHGDSRADDASRNVPPSLLAAQIAHGQIGLIQAWLSGRGGCSADRIATLLWTASRAIASTGV